MSDITKLQAAARKANRALHRAQEQRAAKLNAAMVGKCFRYKNSYGPKEPGDYFWFYLRVLSTDGFGVRCHTFQTDNDGRIEIQWNNHRSSYQGALNGGYEPISQAQFDKAWQELKKCVLCHTES